MVGLGGKISGVSVETWQKSPLCKRVPSQQVPASKKWYTLRDQYPGRIGPREPRAVTIIQHLCLKLEQSVAALDLIGNEFKHSGRGLTIAPVRDSVACHV